MHDQNFKNLILDYPVQALEFFAGEEAGADLSEARIVPVRQEQLMERLGDRFRELDTPLLVEWSEGQRSEVRRRRSGRDRDRKLEHRTRMDGKDGGQRQSLISDL